MLAGDLDSDGVSIGANALTVPSDSSIQDADEIDAVIAHAAVSDDPEHQVDGVVATVSDIGFITTGPYVLDDAIEVAVTFSEAVTVSGTPQLPLIVGGFTRRRFTSATRARRRRSSATRWLMAIMMTTGSRW